MESFGATSEKFKHLEKGFKPIMVCLDTQSNICIECPDIFNPDKTDYVDLYSESKPNESNFISSVYVISKLDSKDKYEYGYKDCIGLVVVGESKDSDENISIISHIDFEAVLANSEDEESFKKSVISIIQELKNKVKAGSIDCLLFGGNSYENNPDEDSIFDSYKKYIKYISSILKQELGFSPNVITGPKEREGDTDIYFNNQNRRLYLFMPQQDKNISLRDFNSEQVEDQIKKIKESN